ncbi:type II toxin-antitoxin system ParD family antitoxin [Nanoarchaeota archaeon]
MIHIRVGKELKKQMQELVDSGLFSNQAEIAREGIREILLKYKNKK